MKLELEMGRDISVEMYSEYLLNTILKDCDKWKHHADDPEI